MSEDTIPHCPASVAGGFRISLSISHVTEG